MEEIENGIRVIHEWLGTKQAVEITYHDGRLRIAVGDRAVFLDEGETAYVLAHLASWYDQGE